MEKAYKGFTGSYSILKDGDEKHSATHVVLTNEEYRKLRHDILELEAQMKSDSDEYRNSIAEINKKATIYKENVEEEAQNRIKAAEEKAKAAELERQRQADLNVNLIRIMKERANAKRNLRPKKEHSGYRFVGKIMQITVVAGYNKQTGPVHADAWTAVLETPYNCTISIKQIEDRIFMDLIDSNVLAKLNIKGSLEGGRLWKGTYKEALGRRKEGENLLFDYRFVKNPKSGLWEIKIVTINEISVNPEMVWNIREKAANEYGGKDKQTSYDGDYDLDL